MSWHSLKFTARFFLAATFLVLWVPLGAHAQDTTSEASISKETLKARVERRRGEVESLKDSAKDWRNLKRRIVLLEGDTVHTLPKSGALATLLDNSTIILDASTRLMVREMYRDPETRKVQVLMDLAGGAVDCDVRKVQTDDSRFVVRTPTATAAVRGTKFRVSYLNGRSTVTVLEGTVDVLDKVGREIRLADKMELEAGLSGGGEAAAAPAATLTGMQQAFRAGQRGAPVGAVDSFGQAVGAGRDDIPMDTSEKRPAAADDDEF